MKEKTIFRNYLKQAPNISEINYWNFPESVFVKINNINTKTKPLKKIITVKKLKSIFGKNKEINKKITHLIYGMSQRFKFKIKLPISLLNPNFVKIYSLMLSEGNYKNTFKIQVPEEIFHDIFKNSIAQLFGSEISSTIKQKTYNNGVKISYGTKIIKDLLPFPEHLPKSILENKEFARTYLQIAFEAEGYAYLKRPKRYIRLTRNVGIDNLVTKNLRYKEGSRIFFGRFKEDYPKIAEKVKQNLPITLLGEQLLLKHHFDIDSTLSPEAILINKTNFRRGKRSAKWALCIYSDSINRFIEEINFLSEKKTKICDEMKKMNTNRPAYFCLGIMKTLSKKSIFSSKDFRMEMKKLGYVTPQKYLWFYKKKGKIQHISKGIYKLKSN